MFPVRQDLRFEAVLTYMTGFRSLIFDFPSQGRFFAGTPCPQQRHLQPRVPWRLPYGVLRQPAAATAGVFPRLCLRAAGQTVACFYGQLEPDGHGTASGHQHVLRHGTTLLRTGACNRRSLHVENWNFYV